MPTTQEVMSAGRHRKTQDPLASLTANERHEIFQRRLASEVADACDRWLRKRGFPRGTLQTGFTRYGTEQPDPPEDAATGQAGGNPATPDDLPADFEKV